MKHPPIGPDGSNFPATTKYAPLDNWKGNINDKNSTTLYSSYNTAQTQNSNLTSQDLNARKNGSKFDSWSTFISLLELINFYHPFEKSLKCGKFLDHLRSFKFSKNMLYFSDVYSPELLELFEKVLTIETENIEGVEQPIRWGVEEIVSSSFYKNIRNDCNRLRRKIFVFMRIVYDDGLYYLFDDCEEAEKEEIVKYYSDLQKKLFNNNFTKINSPAINVENANCLFSNNYNCFVFSVPVGVFRT